MIVRGGIYWVDYRGTVGAEIRKRRPAVVISEDEHNAHMRTVTVVPFSSPGKTSPTYEVAIPAGVVGDGRPCRAKPHQIRAVDRVRLGRKIGSLPPELLGTIEASLLLHLGFGDGRA